MSSSLFLTKDRFPVKKNSIFKENWTAIRIFAMYRKFSTVYNMRETNNDISAAINSEDILCILDDQVHKFKN